MSVISSVKQDAIELNLAVAQAHFHCEANNEIERALALFTEDIVWESPGRGLVLRGKREVGDNYRRMFCAFEIEAFRCLQRFATEDRVVDDSVMTALVVSHGIRNSPVPVGSKVEVRILHVFEMRDGKISREVVFENWKQLQPEVDRLSNVLQPPVSCSLHSS